MKISPSIRISFGLVMFTLSVILIADLFGIVPNKEILMLEARKKVSESLAVQLSVAASMSEFKMIETTLELFVDRNDDVVAASMSKVDGIIIAQYGDFIHYEKNVYGEVEQKSTDNVVVVPVFAGEQQWGSINVEYSSIYAVGWFSLLTDSLLGILLFVAFGCFTGYLFILRKALKVLDPKSVVPDRVRTAFNTLSEGVMIMDDKEQIIMANNAFAEKINENPDDLLGVKASSLKWRYLSRDHHKSNEKMPWVIAIKDGVNKVGVALKLSTRKSGVRSLSTNCAPIFDDKGKSRGALVTFSDVTEVEETNVLLENAVSTLKNNEVEIKKKNSELEVLATRDPLTGCYNRRAFFAQFEKAYDDSESSGKPLSCIMLDIDHFKSVNDRFGHAVGDEVIRLISDVLNNNGIRDDAIVARYGGEEFCIALPDCVAEDATKVAEHFRQAIQTTSKDFCAKNVTITSSFGVSCNSGTVSNCSQMLEEADKALYVAKESGRNRVICWQQGGTTLSSINDTVVIDLDDITNEDSDDASSDNGKIALLQSKVESLQGKLDYLSDCNEVLENCNVDPITNLPSEAIFKDRVNQAMAYALRSEKLMAVATLNIDMFSRIKDTMGNTISDEFLRAVGHRLKDVLRSSDTVASMIVPGQAGPSFARLKDDEFALLLTGLSDVESLTYVIKRIQNKFSGKIEVAGNEIYVTTSIGISVFPVDESDVDQLIENARRARKQAKQLRGRNNYQFYSLADNSKVVNQMQLEIDLHNAIEEQQFVLYYQPKLDISSGDVASLEALIRWEHPTKGLVFPDNFIPVAEKTGMILDIGKWCLLEACKQTKRWVDMGATNLRTSVNMSACEFSDVGFKDNVLKALKGSGLDARHLEIEITESTIMADQIAAQKLIDELRFQGVTITLDDFGTGYSSLSYFGHLELDWLKLDRSFLLEAMNLERSRTIYSSIVEMVHATGVKVVSEGVETLEQYEYIKDMEVDEMQGYLLSKPVTAELTEAILFPKQDKKVQQIN
jgi:diguanylate cyclase (GGDEF)-like protein